MRMSAFERAVKTSERTPLLKTAVKESMANSMKEFGFSYNSEYPCRFSK